MASSFVDPVDEGGADAAMVIVVRGGPEGLGLSPCRNEVEGKFFVIVVAGQRLQALFRKN
jgi:hypothetical protein